MRSVSCLAIFGCVAALSTSAFADGRAGRVELSVGTFGTSLSDVQLLYPPRVRLGLDVALHHRAAAFVDFAISPMALEDMIGLAGVRVSPLQRVDWLYLAPSVGWYFYALEGNQHFVTFNFGVGAQRRFSGSGRLAVEAGAMTRPLGADDLYVERFGAYVKLGLGWTL